MGLYGIKGTTMMANKSEANLSVDGNLYKAAHSLSHLQVQHSTRCQDSPTAH